MKQTSSGTSLTLRAMLVAGLGLLVGGCNFGGTDRSQSVAAPSGASAAACAAQTLAGSADVDGPTTIVLLDRTTVLEPQDRAQLVRELTRYWRRDGGRISIALTGGVSSALVRTLYEGSLPGGAGARHESDRKWSTTPAEARHSAACAEHSVREFGQVLAKALDDTDPSDQALSPLIEAVAAELGAAARRRGDWRLVLLTDGMQNTQSLSLYQRRTDSLRAVDPKSLVESLVSVGVMPDAQGVSVVHLAIGMGGAPRQGEPRRLRPPAETRQLEALWTAVYRAGGARSIAFGYPLAPGGIRFPESRS